MYLWFRVQVEDEDFYDGPDDESEYDSDDSNGTTNSVILSSLRFKILFFYLLFVSFAGS